MKFYSCNKSPHDWEFGTFQPGEPCPFCAQKMEICAHPNIVVSVGCSSCRIVSNKGKKLEWIMILNQGYIVAPQGRAFSNFCSPKENVTIDLSQFSLSQALNALFLFCSFKK